MPLSTFLPIIAGLTMAMLAVADNNAKREAREALEQSLTEKEKKR